MDKTNSNWNDKALKAWNLWKEICSVAGCPDSAKNILSSEIYNAFQKTFLKLCPASKDDIFRSVEAYFAPPVSDNAPESSNDAEKCETDKEQCENEDEPQDRQTVYVAGDRKKVLAYWANEFDLGIIAKAGARPLPEVEENDTQDASARKSLNGDLWVGIAKDYKDHTWMLCRESSDPPLKIIRGKLIGSQGFINAIADYHLYQYHNELWHNLAEVTRNKRRKNSQKEIIPISHISLHAPVNSRKDPADEDSWEKLIPGNSPLPDTSADSTEDEIAEVREKLQQFTNFDLGLILAKAANMQSSESTERFLNAGHNKISQHWNRNLQKKALRMFTELSQKYIIKVILERLEQEPGFKEFYTAIKPGLIAKHLEEYL